jgi:hypothetical protein
LAKLNDLSYRTYDDQKEFTKRLGEKLSARELEQFRDIILIYASEHWRGLYKVTNSGKRAPLWTDDYSALLPIIMW